MSKRNCNNARNAQENSYQKDLKGICKFVKEIINLKSETKKNKQILVA